MDFNPILSDLLQQIGQKLRQVRQVRNEKLVTVANAIGISHAVISLIENGRYNCLSFALLSKLTHHYNITINEVLTCTE